MKMFIRMLFMFFSFFFMDISRVMKCEGGFIRFGGIGNMLMEEEGGGEGGAGGGGGEGSDGEGGSGEGKGKGEGKGDPDPNDKGANDFEDLPDWAKKEIGDLRKENASRRKSGKDVGDRLDNLQNGLKKAFGIEQNEEVDLNEQVSGLTERLEESQFHNAIVEMAYENEIPKDKISFFKFRLNEALQSVGEEEELPAEVMSAIVQEVKGAGKGAGSTDLEGDEGGKKPTGEGEGKKKDFSKMSAEEFVKTSDSDKNLLFKNDRATYDRLHSEAKVKRLYR